VVVGTQLSGWQGPPPRMANVAPPAANAPERPAARGQQAHAQAQHPLPAAPAPQPQQQPPPVYTAPRHGRNEATPVARIEPFVCGRVGFGLVRGGAAAGRGVNVAMCEPGLPWGMR